MTESGVTEMDHDLFGAGVVRPFHPGMYSYSRTPPPLVPCNQKAPAAYNLHSLDEDRYRLTLPAAGFGQGDIMAQIQGGVLRIEGHRRPSGYTGRRLHQGLSDKIDCSFLLLDTLDIVDVAIRDGLLAIDLERDSLEPYAISSPSKLVDKSYAVAAA
jgi:HSP20 family molecular chaperone IbpA